MKQQEGKKDKSTPHFYSLPQGERREGRKDFKKTPHPNPLPQSGEGRKKAFIFRYKIFQVV
jgi:hypothetical protein